MSLHRAIVFGAAGQDGSYLVSELLARGYEVLGLVHSNAATSLPHDKLSFAQMSLEELGGLPAVFRDFGPTEVYNLAARSSGAGMFDDPIAIGELNGIAVARMLEAIRQCDRQIRFCQASSSELFGEATDCPQSEVTPLRPRSPYGAAKLYAHWMLGIYRKRHGIFACSALLFNHESPRRGLSFVTRKVTRAAARISLGLAELVELGNLQARRDWGFAGDYMRAMYLMLQQDEPRDYVVATGTTHSVRQLCEVAFDHVGLDYERHVVEAPADFRSSEPVQLVGDASLARSKLGWSPTVGFEQMIRSMVDHDLALLQSQASASPD
jgi:GDPmannose 4,6-dehydratase